MSRESRARWPRASAGLAKWSPPERRAPRSIGSGKRPLVFPDDADHDALDDYIALVDAQRLHRVIGRLQSDPATWLAIVTFDRGALAVDQRDDGLSGLGLVPLLNDDVIAVLDVLVDHGVAAHLQHVAAAAARQELVRDGNRLVAGDGLDRMAGGNESEERQLGRPGLPFGRDDLDGPALVVGAPDVAFALEIGEVLVHRRQGLESELLGDFLEAGGVPLLFDVLGDVIEDLALASRDWHGWLPKIYRNIIYPKNARMQG